MSAETDLAEAKRRVSTAQMTADNAKSLLEKASTDYETLVDKNLAKYGSEANFPPIIASAIAAAQNKLNVAGQVSKDADAALAAAKNNLLTAEHNAAIEQQVSKQDNTATPGPNTQVAEVAATPVVTETIAQPTDPLAQSKLDAADKHDTPALSPTEASNLANGDAAVEETDPFEQSRLDAIAQGDIPPPSYYEITGEDDGSFDAKETARLSASNQVNQSNVPLQVTTSNRLHNYASYTYSLSLHALTKEDYAAINADPGSYVPKNVLIASAGRRNSTEFIRNARFSDDFFFERLSMTTVIGMTQESRNSNAIEIKFTIVEPYGMTLMERIIFASRDLNSENFRDMPYMLQIDFYGYDDNGIPEKIKDITKNIPIKFISFTTKVSISGATYEIDAIPYNHGGFLESSAAITPIKLEVLAQNIGEFFMANEEVMPEIVAAKEVRNQIEAEQTQLSAQQARERDAAANGDLRDRAALARTTSEMEALNKKYIDSVPAALNVRSYADAINAWKYYLLADNKVDYQDQIRFEFASDKMINAKFPKPEDISAAGTPMKDAKATQNGLHTGRFNDGPTAALMSINQGTSIIDVIGLALRNSDYIRDQLSDPDSDNMVVKDNNALDWFKIIPKVRILPYDNGRNTYAKEYIYRVVPYKIYNTENSYAPMGRPRGWVKDYQYMFTGKNIDVIDFDIQFDALYWTAQSAGSANKDSITGAADASPSQSRTSAAKNKALSKIVKNKKDQYGVLPEFRSTQSHVANATSVVSLAEDSLGDKAALAEQMLSAAGDLLTVKLKIVGDPDFIKQDDLFYSSASYQDMRTPNGSISTDEGEIFINLTFYTPVDYNDKGLADPSDSSYVTSVYSGLYGVLQVTSTFANGKFEQELETYRYALQPSQGFETEGNADSRPDVAESDVNPSDLRLAAGTAALPLDSLTMKVPSIDDVAKTAGGDLTSVMGKIKDTASTVTENISAATAKLTQATTGLGSGFSNLGSIDVDTVGKILPTTTNAISSADKVVQDFKNSSAVKYITDKTKPPLPADEIVPIPVDTGIMSA